MVELEAASADERFARESLKSKWQETDNLQSIVKKVKDAMSIDDVDNRVCNLPTLEHTAPFILHGDCTQFKFMEILQLINLFILSRYTAWSTGLNMRPYP